MAKPKSPEGKRVTICVKVSEADAAAIDVARGELTRSAWGRGLMLAAVLGEAPAPVKVPRQAKRADAAPVPSSSPEIEKAAVWLAEVAPAPKAEKCPHPKARVLKGTCRACMTYVGKA